MDGLQSSPVHRISAARAVQNEYSPTYRGTKYNTKRTIFSKTSKIVIKLHRLCIVAVIFATVEFATEEYGYRGRRSNKASCTNFVRLTRTGDKGHSSGGSSSSSRCCTRRDYDVT